MTSNGLDTLAFFPNLAGLIALMTFLIKLESELRPSAIMGRVSSMESNITHSNNKNVRDGGREAFLSFLALLSNS